ncbi:MAG: hypothetical protein IGS49_29430 [Chlorogloeopsis fritschii C42_A2020_084]|uniref:hypothetical protein n=1 Tax=Chlorogloeopsis fritschii TaxID=1124 RepID=UPI001A0CDC69|nr:hypothetical protein [Chlorogloeopsis fritschii]MBF2009438.1 hypothetical protein [Chlorogloeopsis fritschii C42_A2020_084]
MNLTPHWQQIQQNYAEAHAYLQWLAGAIYEQSEETVPIPAIDEVDLNPGIKLGLITSNEGKIGFSNPEVRDDYLVRYAVDLVLAAWDEPEKLIDLFDNIYSFSICIKFSGQIGVNVLLVLESEYQKDIVDRISELTRLEFLKEKPDKSREEIYDLFCDALPQFEVKLESLVEVFELILQTHKC